MAVIECAIGKVPSDLQGEVASHWQAYIEAADGAGLEPLSDSAILTQLARVWACSGFVALACVRSPELLSQFVGSGTELETPPVQDCRTRLASQLQRVENEDQLGLALRRFRRQEMVRIAWRDLAGTASLEETLADLSDLADAAVDAALDLLYTWHTKRVGIPRDGKGRPQRLVVLGLGKLGGQELNFSSDIDLIFAFPDKGETDGVRAIANDEFFLRLGQRLINVLSANTSEGFVFRVDMRLRPFGDSGPLVMSFPAMEAYYQNQGREWERYAMIKARPIAGDIAQGERLLTVLRPFVYRRYLDFGAFESLRAMKALIAKEVERKGLQRNVKLGPGGIREIEFIGQAFQLIYGGREPRLRTRSILQVLDYLGETERLPKYAIAGLLRAYTFLRQTENRLQAWSDQQTHNLPEDEVAKVRLAFAMGYSDWGAYVKALMRHVQAVSGQFEQVFAAPQTETGAEPAGQDFKALWSGAVGDAAAISFLRDQGFDDPTKALECVRQLRQSFSCRALSKQGRERMDRLIPLLLGAVSGAPDSVATLQRVLSLVETIARRSVYLSLLVENPMALSQLVKLCAASVWIAEYLTRYPLLLDDLLDPASLYAPLQRARLDAELERDLARVASGDTEQVMETLRHFKHTNVLRVAAADVSGAMPLMIVSDHLTEIAEVLLRRILTLAWADLTARFGSPKCRVAGAEIEPGFVIVAYGKLGGIELGYGSDLDLVFLHDSRGDDQTTVGPKETDNATFFIKLAHRLIHMLTAHTAAGVLYEVDTRLRPSGQSGLLVCSIDAFAEYERNQAWTWEHQALIRARPVAGSPRLAERFEELRREILSRPREPEELRREVRDMRERMRAEHGSSRDDKFDIKQDPGGIADIEFLVQFAVLANAHQHPELLEFTDNIRQLDALERVAVLSANDAALLRDAYRELRRRGHLLKLENQSSLIERSELEDYRHGIVRIWQTVMEGGDRQERD